MDLWLVRHGEAVPERADPSRPLTADGVRAITAVASSLRAGFVPLDLVASSGKTRALQTAAIFAEAAGYPPEKIVQTHALSPNAAPAAFHAFLEECGEANRVLCAGHLPSIAAIASYFLSAAGPVRLVFGPGTVCRIHIEAVRPGGGDLLRLV